MQHSLADTPETTSHRKADLCFATDTTDIPVTGPDGKPVAPQLEILCRALPLMTNGVYIQLDHRVQALCKRLSMNLKPKGDPLMATWRPKGSLFFTIIKTPNDTVLYSHANDTIYYTHSNMKLAVACPPYTAFLAQYTEDKGVNGPMARMLVFDVLDSSVKDPAARNEALRSMEALLPQPLCIVQWAGQSKALGDFVFHATLPHEVEALIGIGENPLMISRTLLVKIPENSFADTKIQKLQ